MSRNGSGTHSLPAGNPVVTGTTISSTVMNNTLSDISNALTESLARDGQTTPTANLPMSGYAHTGVGDATARTQYAKVSQIQDGGYVTLSSVSGTDTITATCAPAITAYAAGQFFTFVSAGANTGAVTLNINSLGAKAVTKEGTTALAAGDIASGAVVCVEYDGTRFQLVGGRRVQPLDATLTALAGLNADAGLVEQTGADTFTKRAIGTASGNVPVVGTASATETLAGLSRRSTTAEAQAGVEDTAYMTALKTKQAIDGSFKSMQVFTSSGTWTKPTGLKRVKVTVIGGGGGGGGAIGGSRSSGGGGGGASVKVIEASALGSSETVTIGAGGAGGAGNANGSAGGTSSFGSHCSATGGGGGTVNGTGGLGGLGGIGSSGALNIAGAGGGCLEPDNSGYGGSSILGGGGRAVLGDSNGAAGGSYGGGGSGASTASGGSLTGGAGAAGVVIVEEFF